MAVDRDTERVDELQAVQSTRERKDGVVVADVDPVGILIVPTENRPGAFVDALLSDGPCGSEPPRVSRGDSCGEDLGWLDRRLWLSPMALPLWWDGVLVPEGWDRVRRVYMSLPASRRHWGRFDALFEPFCPTNWGIRGFALQALVDSEVASRYILIDRAPDGKRVERVP